jgi:amphi-Trp domain-containing protein
MDNRRALEFSAHCEPGEVAEYIETLAHSLRTGTARLGVGDESIQLTFSPKLKLRLAARMKPDKGSLDMAISWRRPARVGELLRIQANGESGAAELDIDVAGCHLLPVGGRSAGRAMERLRSWLAAGFWGVRASRALRDRLRVGDVCAFHVSGVGVVAHARVAGEANRRALKKEWPGPGPFEPKTFKIPLAGVSWLEEPTRIDAGLRSRLDAFRGRPGSWSWFVRSARPVTENDFRLLTGQPQPEPSA